MVPWRSAQYPIWVKAGTAVDIQPGSGDLLAYALVSVHLAAGDLPGQDCSPPDSTDTVRS